MPLETAQKSVIIKQFGGTEKNTGSAPVQVALLSQRITELTEHLKAHKKDFHSRRGLLLMVARRAKLLKYVAKHDIATYRTITEQLGIRQKV